VTGLLPRSLFGRMVLVMLAGLAVAQLLSFAIHMEDRVTLLRQASGLQSVQRIADTVRLLDAADAAGRQRIVRVLSAPPLRVTLGAAALAPPVAAERPDGRGALLAAMLRSDLGDAWPVLVVRTEDAPGAAPGRGMHGEGYRHGRHPPGREGGWRGGGPGRGFAFVAQVRLGDGTLATFDARQPEAAPGWPLRLILSLLVLTAAVVIVTLVAVRWATRPLQALARAADALGRDLHSPPMDETGPVEVARAARAFNAMQVRLGAYLRERTSVLAAMSHDLKTPVTRLRLRAELLPDPDLRARFTRDLEELETMVADTLAFLRGGEAGQPRQPVDMTALLESLQADLAEEGREVRITGRASRPYVGEPTALKRCLRNLLENAVNYGEHAEVVVEDAERRLRILVRDEGPGIPDAELENVFEPFRRLEGSRNRDTGGTGLGLTIARSIAHAHGGSLTLANRPQGGLEAVLELPRS
jgi:signal transduction histidine kinase